MLNAEYFQVSKDEDPTLNSRIGLTLTILPGHHKRKIFSLTVLLRQTLKTCFPNEVFSK